MSATHTASMTPLICWSCRERALGPHFCSNCGKIQQLPRDVDYFAFFGLPRKLWIEGAELEKKFLQLSWQLNDAYRTLREPISRIEYLLAIEGARKEGEHKQQAPPELLEEVFGLNESLDALREAKTGGGDLSALKTRLEAAENNFQEKLAEVDEQLQGIAREWDAALDKNVENAARNKLMARMNDLLNRRSYIRNLVRNVAAELAG